MELILHNSWKTLCDSEFKAKEKLVPKSGVVFCHTDDLFEFFKVAKNNPQNTYILISADSDYGLEYQDNNTVSSDIFKWMRFIPTDFVKGYDPLVILPRCNVNSCKLSDQFCLKMYSFTKDTIDELLPDNIVLWWGTNINVSCGRLTKIPFGISPETAKHLKHTLLETKIDKIYCNFQLNTIERHELLSHLKYYDRCHIELGISNKQYAESISKYKYILAPSGNGLSSYRILEAIYSGSVPIVNNDFWSEECEDLPIIRLNINDLNEVLNVSYNNKDFILENSKADLNYWRKLIFDFRTRLL